MGNSIALIIAICIIICVIALQIWSFLQTKQNLKTLELFFPKIENLKLKQTSITHSILENENLLQNFLTRIPAQHIKNEDDEDDEEYTDLSLIELKQGTKSFYFSLILSRTNKYLCKNVGTSADFSTLKEICEHQLEILTNEINNTLNIPLYIGLAGTFIGIITGLFGIDFNIILNDNGNMDGLQHLIYGIIIAMCASFLGLALTIYSGRVFRKDIIITDNQKEDYYDFLRRELMPVLTSSMASSLNSLKGVLGHFVDKFGRNLDAYADSAELLNDNLEKQHLVLEEINKLSLTRTANKIAETFVTLKDSSDSLNVFKSYQDQLNGTIKDVNKVVSGVTSIITKFEDFNNGLSVVIKNQNETNSLQQEFKEAIETHFPTGQEGREIWRKEFDLLISDAKQVTDNLSLQLTASTEYIKNFVTDNSNFFDSFNKLQEVLSTLVQYSQVQADCYKDLKGEILNLRKDYKDAQIENIDLNKSIIKAIEKMTDSLNK